MYLILNIQSEPKLSHIMKWPILSLGHDMHAIFDSFSFFFRFCYSSHSSIPTLLWVGFDSSINSSSFFFSKQIYPAYYTYIRAAYITHKSSHIVLWSLPYSLLANLCHLKHDIYEWVLFQLRYKKAQRDQNINAWYMYIFLSKWFYI